MSERCPLLTGEVYTGIPEACRLVCGQTWEDAAETIQPYIVDNDAAMEGECLHFDQETDSLSETLQASKTGDGGRAHTVTCTCAGCKTSLYTNIWTFVCAQPRA